MEQLKHIMLGHRIHIWVHVGGTGIIFRSFSVNAGNYSLFSEFLLLTFYL